jgi:calcium-dependent protein kinase
MSPEIIQGVSDPKTDVWSVGVIMHQMLTGKYPFYSNGKDSLLDLIEKKKFDSSLLDSSDCSDEAKDMVKKILIKDCTKRLSSKQCLEHPWIKKYATQKDSHLLNAQTIKTLKQFSTKSALQKEIYFFIAKVSKEKEILQLKQLFNQLDTKNAGSLTISEIEKAFAEIGIIIPDEDLKMIWEGLDFHKDGEVNYTEFLAAMVSSYKFEKEEKLWTVFNYFKDNTNKNNKSIFDSDDYISFDSLLNAVNSLNLNINEQAIKNNFEQFKGKKINFEQFKEIILSSEEKF